mmetsp:Transcript_31873/g.49574  ORF Transcript_31873/g.49574 Transcript_31873/m.49574 type:complete len:287 (+) Transcript_31873:93-953(+)|eukprot:CAMPEP_0169103516 /NCGR_PEP_ID=MMETSP1015-20121227/22760_1 /TAXON_ID=342587 /ORGANISM="Karlodinium micrum, Strain CCMP2283" /LENGTH=286 /DNA_ID=CAMNT_0009164725 /DNA_START=283 /DNA_END=1143 /DNA_ORIENTATION=-
MDPQAYEVLPLNSGNLLECEEGPLERDLSLPPSKASRQADSRRCKLARAGVGLALVACVAVAVIMFHTGSPAAEKMDAEDTLSMYTDPLFCAAYDGVMGIGEHACCPEACGAKCGASDCHLGTGGPTQCCWRKMLPVYCEAPKKAPCLIPPPTTTTTSTTTTTTTTVAYNVYTGNALLESSMPLTILGNSVDSKAAIEEGLQHAFKGSTVRVTTLSLAEYQGIGVKYIFQLVSPAVLETDRFPGSDETALIEIKEALVDAGFQDGVVSKVTLDTPVHTISATPVVE